MATNAVTLDGSTQYGKIDNFSDLDGLDEFTIEGWFKQNASGGNSYAIAVQIGDGTDELCVYKTENATPSTGINYTHDHSTTNAAGYKASGVFDTGTWVHVAMRGGEGDDVDIIKDGVEITYNLEISPVGTVEDSTGMDVYHGVRHDIAKHFKGDVACLRIWNVKRTDAELAANKDYYLDPSKETGLIVNCNFDEGSGTTVDNDASAGDDLNLTGSPSWTTGPTLTAKQYPTDPGGAWYNASWDYRKWVGVLPGAGAGTNYQMKITVHYGSGTDVGADVYMDSKCETDFADIRFTDDDGTTLLDHWLQEKTDSDNAIFWVEVADDTSTNVNEIYVYYGNSGASSASNGPNTFLFFDDFSGDLSKWTVHTSSGSYPQIVSGVLECGGGSTGGSPYGHTCLGSDATYTGFDDNAVDFKYKQTTNSIGEIGYRGDQSGNTGYKGRYDARGGSEECWYKPPYSGWGAFGSSVTRFGDSGGSWHLGSIRISGSTHKIYVDDVLKSTETDSDYSSAGEISLQNHYGDYTHYDDVRVRKYVSSEPVFDTWGSEESAPAAGIASQRLLVGHGA